MERAIGNFTSYTAPQQGIYDPLAVGIGGFMGGTQYAADRKAIEQERAFAEESRGRVRADWLSEDQYNEQMKAIAEREAALEARIAGQRATAAEREGVVQAIMAPPAVPVTAAPAQLPRGGGVLAASQNSPGATPATPSVPDPRAAMSRALDPVAALGGVANKPVGAPPAALVPGAAPLAPQAAPAAPQARVSPFDPELMRERINLEYERSTAAEKTKSTKFGEAGRASRANAETMYRKYLDAGTIGARNALEAGNPKAFDQWKKAYPDLAAAAGVDDWRLLKTETVKVDGFDAPAYIFADEKGNPLPPVSGPMAEALIGSIAQDPEVFDKNISRLREQTTSSVDRQHKATVERHDAQRIRQTDAAQKTQQEQFATQLAADAARFNAQQASDNARHSEEMQLRYGSAGAEKLAEALKLSSAIANGAPRIEAAIAGAYKADSNGQLMPGAGGFGEMKVTVGGKTQAVSQLFGADSRIDKSAVVGPALAAMRFSALEAGPGREMGYDEAARIGVYAGVLQELSRQKGVSARIQMADGRMAELRKSEAGVQLQTYRMEETPAGVDMSRLPGGANAGKREKLGDIVPKRQWVPDAAYPTDFASYSNWLARQREAAAQPQGAIR